MEGRGHLERDQGEVEHVATNSCDHCMCVWDMCMCVGGCVIMYVCGGYVHVWGDMCMCGGYV